MLTNTNTELITNCSNTIKELIHKYENNEYMLQRINNHINIYLTNTLENENKNYEKRLNRNNYLTNEQQIFIQVFLSNNQYYYLSSNNFFYEYNGKNYYIVKEDDVIHKLLSSISKDKILMQWKHKTKLNIIKQIKERNLFNSIPESDTIQNVLNMLYPSIFDSKNTAKYFLTIIGDNILKKNQHLIFLVPPPMKKLLCELDNITLNSIGYSNTTANFMTKYHENHTYDNCRLIKINETFSTELWRDILKKIGLNLLCVATHYSKRYENSDKFIEHKSDEEMKNYAYYLKNSHPNNIVLEFTSKYLMETVDNINIEWKNLHFVWKTFLSNSNLPNIMYSNTLKNSLKEKYKYDEQRDCFIGITSKYIPIQSDFIKFWEATITFNGMESEEEKFCENDLEIDEICSLFKVWAKQNSSELLTNGNISEDNVLKILKHFFHFIEIIEDKYILNISCSLWDKIGDINKSFNYIKEEILKNNDTNLISFDDAYNYYYKYCNKNSFKFIVSKHYFEKYLYFKLSDHIVYDKFIESNCFM